MKKIFKKQPKSDTGFEYVSFDGRALWGVDNQGTYCAFSNKYYTIEIVEEFHCWAEEFMNYQVMVDDSDDDISASVII